MQNRILEITINTTDAERSIDFYRVLGFEVVEDGVLEGPTVGRAFNVDGGRVRYVHLRLGQDKSAPVLDIVQWFEPPITGEPLKQQNHRGITRFAVQTGDVVGTCDRLRTQGARVLVEPIVSGATSEGEWRICLVEDPDGVTVQLVEIRKIENFRSHE